MSDQNETKQTSGVPKWFWVVSIIALLWNLMGLMAFVVQIFTTEAMLNELPVAQAELMKSTPSWVNVAFGVAVVGGVLGCIALLMRKKLAFPVFVLSLLGVLGQQTYMFFLSDTMKIMEMGPAFPIMILAVAILLVLFSKFAIGKHWLS